MPIHSSVQSVVSAELRLSYSQKETSRIYPYGRQHKILDCSYLEFIMDNTLGLVDLGLNDLNILNFFFKSEKKVILNLDIYLSF